MGLFVPLDVAWMDNPKVIRVGLEGAGLHAMAMCLAKRTETDGILHRSQLYRLGATDDLIDHLLAEELLDPVECGKRPGEDPDVVYVVRVHDWHDRNPSQEEIADRRREAGRRGNHSRYNHPGPFETCPKCSQPSQSSQVRECENLRESASESASKSDPENDVSEARKILANETVKPQVNGGEALANGSQNLAKLAIDIDRERDREKENPSVTSADADITAEEFERFWEQYPRRNGKRLEKDKALTVWRRMSRTKRDLAMAGVENYADSGQRAKDAHRWLRDECWKDWQTPAVPDEPRPALAVVKQRET